MKVWEYIMGEIRSSFGKVFPDVLFFVFNSFFTLKLLIKKDKKPIHLKPLLLHNIYWLCKTNWALHSICHRTHVTDAIKVDVEE